MRHSHWLLAVMVVSAAMCKDDTSLEEASSRESGQTPSRGQGAIFDAEGSPPSFTEDPIGHLTDGLASVGEAIEEQAEAMADEVGAVATEGAAQAEALAQEVVSAGLGGVDLLSTTIRESGLSLEDVLVTLSQVYFFNCSPGQLKNEILLPLLDLVTRCSGLLCRFAQSVGYENVEDVPLTAFDGEALLVFAGENSAEGAHLAVELGRFFLLATLKLDRCAVPFNPMWDVATCLRTTLVDQLSPIVFAEGVFNPENVRRFFELDFAAFGQTAFECMRDVVSLADVAVLIEGDRLNLSCTGTGAD